MLCASSRLIHTPSAHIRPPFEPSRNRRGWGSLAVMASTQVARAAAQLHEAAQDVARVAAVRSDKSQEPTTKPLVPQQPRLMEGLDHRVPDAARATVPVDGQDA